MEESEAERVVVRARQLFNERAFWETHEVLEALWKQRQGSEKSLVQGLILVAAAYVHAQKSEWAVVWSMLERARRHLEGQPALYHGWDVGKLRDEVSHILATRSHDFPTV